MLSASLSTTLSNRGLEPLVEDAARSRLQRSAEHMAELAAVVYADERGWSPHARETLSQLSRLDGLSILLESGAIRFGSRLDGLETARARITLGQGWLGTITVAQSESGLLTPEETHLQSSLDRLHLIAGGVSVLVALLLAFILAETLSRRLRRIRAAAHRIARGDLQTRVPSAGDAEIRSVGKALNALAETLEHEEQLRKRTVADLAHELRTPVNGLLARIEAAQDRLLTGPDNLDAMHEEALRLTRLVDDLARLADAEQPGLLLEKHRLDLSEPARAAARSLEPQYADAAIQLTVRANPVWIDGNRRRIEQIVTNLLTNALRYTREGGSVELLVHQFEDAAVLEVADSGIGIRPEELDNVFTRFWRSDPSRSPKTGGTGIGLAIVRELVRAHGGRVEAQSTFGAGSPSASSCRRFNRPCHGERKPCFTLSGLATETPPTPCPVSEARARPWQDSGAGSRALCLRDRGAR